MRIIKGVSPWDQLQLETSLPQTATLADIEQLLRLRKAVGLSDGDREKVDLRYMSVPTQGGTQSVPFWNGEELDKLDATGNTMDLQVESADFDKLRQFVKARQNWPADERSVALKRKLDEAEEVTDKKKSKG